MVRLVGVVWYTPRRLTEELVYIAVWGVTWFRYAYSERRVALRNPRGHERTHVVVRIIARHL